MVMELTIRLPVNSMAVQSRNVVNNNKSGFYLEFLA